MEQPIVEVIDVSVNFGGVQALTDVSLSIADQEILGLIGPNGAGKTTLFNVISGLQKPSDGEIRLRSKTINRLNLNQICKMGVSRTFQGGYLFKGMTVYENALVAALFAGHARRTSLRPSEIARWALELCDLLDRGSWDVQRLSLFEQKKVEIARALACSPEVLLLDEIASGLRYEETEDVLEVIRRINKEGITVCLIEHDMRAIMSIAQRIVVLSFGKKIAEGSPVEVSANPEVIECYLGDAYA